MKAYKAIITGAVLYNKVKSNGASYVGMPVEIQDGPAKGLTVLATRTTVTKDGVIKSPVNIGDSVTVYHSVLASTKEGEKTAHFFEIGSGVITASNTDLDAVFGL